MTKCSARIADGTKNIHLNSSYALFTCTMIIHFQLLASVVDLMRKCWYPNPLACPTALYLKKKLLRLAMDSDISA